MADPKIIIRRSATPGKVPTENQLALGELAINTYDGKLYLEQDQTSTGLGVTVIAVNPWGVGVGSTAYDTYFTSGNVGLGLTNPTQRLDIDGGLRIRGALYDSNNVVGAAGSILTSTGIGVSWTTPSAGSGGSGESYWSSTILGIHTLSNVGIGTEIPTSKLTVSGDVNVSGVVTANAFVGDGSGLTGIVAVGSGIAIQDEGIQVGSASTTLNFVGTGVSAFIVGNITEVVIDLQGNLDGGFPSSNYGGIENVNGGGI